MKTYIGVKAIDAEPMKRSAYCRLRGWVLPSDEDPDDDGYFIVYPDGYRSWSPKPQFEAAYLEIGSRLRLTPLEITEAVVERYARRASLLPMGKEELLTHLQFVLRWACKGLDPCASAITDHQ